MVSLVKYMGLSVLAASAVVYHAFATRQNFFPSTLYLSTSKMAVAVMGNLAFATALCIHRGLIKVFLGTLRDIENEMIRERLASATMESLLALTIFREEFSAFFMAMFASLVFVKVLHWLVQDRVDYVEVTPTVSTLQHVRIVTFMALLLAIDGLFLQYTVAGTIASSGQSVQLLFAFEYVILASTIIRYFLKYTMSMVDLYLEGRWEAKGTCVFYLELVTDLLHLCVYVVFFIIVFTNYGMPLHLVRDLYSTFRNFRNRITDFMRFRQVTARLDRFPNASAEDLQRSDGVCIICREEMSASGANKRLFCGHVFHLHCLRSWLERQQNCPTCRGSVFRPRPTPAAAAAAAAAAAGGEPAAAAAAAAAAGGAAPGQPGAPQAPGAPPGGQGGAAGHVRMRLPRHLHVMRVNRNRPGEGGAGGGNGDAGAFMFPNLNLGGLDLGALGGAALPHHLGPQPAWVPVGAPLPPQLMGYGADFGQLAMFPGLMMPVPLLPLGPAMAHAFPGVTPHLAPGTTLVEQQAAAAAVAAAITAAQLYSPIGGLLMLPAPLSLAGAGPPPAPPPPPPPAAASGADPAPAGASSADAPPPTSSGTAGDALHASLAAAQSVLQRQLEALQVQMERVRQMNAAQEAAAAAAASHNPPPAGPSVPPAGPSVPFTFTGVPNVPPLGVPPFLSPPATGAAEASPAAAAADAAMAAAPPPLAAAAAAAAVTADGPHREAAAAPASVAPPAAAAPPAPPPQRDAPEEDEQAAAVRRLRLQRFGGGPVPPPAPPQ